MARSTPLDSNQAWPASSPIVAGLSRWVGWLVVLFILGGCAEGSGRLLPTRAQLAATPTTRPAISTAKPVPIPATYTAAAQEPPQAGITWRTPAPEPPATWTAIPSPTPETVLDGGQPYSSAVFLETPPETVPCNGRGLVFRSRFPSRVAGPWRSYHAYLPPCYGRDGGAYPVLYLIHGSIQSDSHWLDLGLAGFADTGIRSGRYPPFIAIMPASGRLGNISSGGSNSIEGVTVDNLLAYVDGVFCSWAAPSGRVIGGISRGGYWALEIAFSHSGLFSAVSGHSSHLRFETDPARYNPLATYASADLSRMRIWLDRGENDFLRAGQELLHESLSAAQIPHEYRVNPGGHSDEYWAGHIGEYLDWLTAAWPRDRITLPRCN